jgi:hypothetical protein
VRNSFEIKEAPGGPEASQGSGSAFQRVIGDPLFGRTRDGDQIFEVIETERSPITPRAGLIPPFSLLFCQIVALMLPQRSVISGSCLLVAILFPPLLK